MGGVLTTIVVMGIMAAGLSRWLALLDDASGSSRGMVSLARPRRRERRAKDGGQSQWR